MAGEINKLIPLYGELNRIYNDWVTNYAFSFDKQKFITDFTGSTMIQRLLNPLSLNWYLTSIKNNTH